MTPRLRRLFPRLSAIDSRPVTPLLALGLALGGLAGWGLLAELPTTFGVVTFLVLLGLALVVMVSGDAILFEPEPIASEEPEPSAEASDAPIQEVARQEMAPPPSPKVPLIPPLELLDTSEPGRPNQGSLDSRGRELQWALLKLGVDCSVSEIRPGPVVTLFELRPAYGVEASEVGKVVVDLDQALGAHGIRLDRLPGRPNFGLEIPNRRPSTISLGHLLEKPPFAGSRSPLTLALGVDVRGEPVVADLKQMPHLLVTGGAGKGKSVALGAMITSILYKAQPDEVKLLLVDPMRVDLTPYAGIPHLMTNVIVEPEVAVDALAWAVQEMERRYRILAKAQKRSIDYLNRSLERALDSPDGAIGDVAPMPFIVIVIDELADVMAAAPSETETSIARLAQMARAVGIHLVVATQHASADVLTETIKANFTCRLVFATATRSDSRALLDVPGAERLLGNGDALFLTHWGAQKIQRIHGAHISKEETAALVRWLRRRGKPEIDPEVIRSRSWRGEDEAEEDSKYEEASRLVVRERQASASFLQRRLRVGFSRAARLVDQMEAEGLVGPARGSKPREVLVPPDYFDRGASGEE